MSAADSLKPLLAELDANPRLRWGLWAIAGILWFYGVLVLRDEVPRQLEAYQTVSRKIARTQVAAAQTEWVPRRDAARSTQVAFENRLWQATTIGLAQASFNDWLGQLARQANVTRLQLSVAAQEGEGAGAAGASDTAASDGNRAPALPGLWKVTARMAFDFTPQSFYPLLAQIVAHDKRVVVESLAIRGSPTPRADLLLVAYFRAPAAGPAARVARNAAQP